MTARSMTLPRSIALWALGPLLLGWTAAELGNARAARPGGPCFGAPSLADAETITNLEADATLAVANGVWALGNADSVRRIAQGAGSRLPASQGAARARLLLRFGLVDRSGEGRAALFSQACQADSRVCTDLSAAVRRETESRLVAPGNVLPHRLAGGPPPGHPSAP